MPYREWPAPADLASDVARIWVLRGTGAVPPALPVPAVDLIVLGDGRVLVTGAERTARRGDLPRDGVLTGFRLLPGSCTALLGVSAADVPADGFELVAARAASPLATGLATLRALVADRTRTPDREVRRVVDLMRARPAVAVGSYAAAVGLSERQLRRRFDAAVGLSPKTFLRVQRLHAVVAARRSRGASWASLAAAAGFYDQQHMLAEFRRVVGCTPDVLVGAADVRFLHDSCPDLRQHPGHDRPPGR
ncbi:helix-turn-helix domain-containing protein [Pseudonocardia sp. CA-107938]|uniref:helix-turn-helix domain-containing protein n=1 Tax=Pseudonocardia sp. CA-107938 TaxID=3240021 RepID=UPI003D907ABC